MKSRYISLVILIISSTYIKSMELNKQVRKEIRRSINHYINEAEQTIIDPENNNALQILKNFREEYRSAGKIKKWLKKEENADVIKLTEKITDRIFEDLEKEAYDGQDLLNFEKINLTNEEDIDLAWNTFVISRLSTIKDFFAPSTVKFPEITGDIVYPMEFFNANKDIDKEAENVPLKALILSCGMLRQGYLEIIASQLEEINYCQAEGIRIKFSKKFNNALATEKFNNIKRKRPRQYLDACND